MTVKNTKQAIKEVLKPHMESKGITEYKLSELTGRPRSTIFRWFSGKNDMPADALIEICDALGLSVEIKEDESIIKEKDGYFYFYTDDGKEWQFNSEEILLDGKHHGTLRSWSDKRIIFDINTDGVGKETLTLPIKVPEKIKAAMDNEKREV